MMASCAISKARLGESAGQSANRYGNPTAKTMYRGYDTAEYGVSGVRITEFYSSRDICVGVIYHGFYSWKYVVTLVWYNTGTIIDLDTWYKSPQDDSTYYDPGRHFMVRLRKSTNGDWVGIYNKEGAELIDGPGSHTFRKNPPVQRSKSRHYNRIPALAAWESSEIRNARYSEQG